MSQRHYTGRAPTRHPSWIGAGLAWVLALCVVVMQVLYPLTDNVDRASLAIATVVVFFLASLVHATVHRGIAGFALVGLAVPLIALLAESAGTHSGWPFGEYQYTDVLGWQLWGVPVVVPLAWSMMAYPTYVVASRLALNRWLVALIGAWSMMAWDIFLDPMMVELGAWSWSDDGPALGSIPEVPLQNFAGWFVIGYLVTLLLTWLPRPGASTSQPVALYLWTYISSVAAYVFFFDRPEVAIIGGLAMGLVALPLIWRVWDYRG